MFFGQLDSISAHFIRYSERGMVKRTKISLSSTKVLYLKKLSYNAIRIGIKFKYFGGKCY